MRAIDAAEIDGGFHTLILGGLAMRDDGYAARRAEVLALRDQGLRPPDIERELQRRAREAGCSDEQIARLGISVHNVRVILRGEVAEEG